MKNMPKFSCARLGGILSVCLCLMLGISAGQIPDVATHLGKLNEFHSDFTHNDQNSPRGLLKLSDETICFPWAKQESRGPESYDVGILRPSQPKKEEIHMDGAHSTEQIGDLRAVNTIKERDVIYDDAQTGAVGLQGSINSMDVTVAGEGRADGRKEEENDDFGDGIERKVDNALTSSLKGVYGGTPTSAQGQQNMGNNIKIDVSGVSASAINTAPGGNAVVNNNIIIKPVQIIVVPSDSKENVKQTK